jgi:hypothetical protein
MTDWNAVSAFMDAVVPWPGEQDPGFVNLHHNVVVNGKLYKGGGRPFRYLDKFVERAAATNGWTNFKGTWFCMSLQRETKPDRNNPTTPKAHRLAANAISLKAIWIDVDVGPKKKFKDLPSAVKAVLAFALKHKLPTPSAMVSSGNGLHVYWISKEALDPTTWNDYAQGLKALLIADSLVDDPGLTTDPARILRVPGTFNHKDPANLKPVELFKLPLTLYDFPTALALLPTLAPAAPFRTQTTTDAPASVFFDDAARIAFQGAKPAPVFAAANLTGSLHEELLPATPIFKQCGFLGHALETNGKDYANPLWHLSVLASTFMENGNGIAHAISSGHPEYDKNETQALYDRKVVERRARGIGYPSCQSIQGNGCKACATCPLFGKIKSPLNIRQVVTATVNQAAGGPQAAPSAASAHGHQQGPNPVARLKTLRDQGADIDAVLTAMNQAFAVTKYGGQIVIASLVDDDISFMTVDDFHKMFANLVIFKVPVSQATIAAGLEPAKANRDKQAAVTPEAIKVSRRWFEWAGRRQFLGRGVVFEPGGPLDVPDDMLNLWRGFGVVPKPGTWSLLRSHIFNVVCSGDQQHFDYLIRLLAYRVQHLGHQTGVAFALLGAPGAGKGVLARTFGQFFGKHFAHISHGDQLTGRFNAALGTASTVFLDEALWAGDRKGEGVLKALITEPQFQVEAKFRDPIMVKNMLFIIVASNNEWAIPAGTGDRRWFVLDVADTYAGLGHQAYFTPLYTEIENGGAAAMLHELLATDLKGFDVRAIPHTAAKAKQQALSLHGSLAWLYDVLQEGSISGEQWQDAGLTIETDRTYMCYVEFSKRQRDWKPEIKSVWSKKIQSALGPQINLTRPTKGNARVRSFQFAPLADCRRQFGSHLCAPHLEWEGESQPNIRSQELPADMWNDEASSLDALDSECGPETDLEPECEIEDGPPD